MEIEIHQIDETQIAEVISMEIIIADAADGLDLLGNLYYQGFDRIIMQEKNIAHAFFDLKTGIAGEILQKFSNYRVRLAIVGDFSKYDSQSFKDFRLESNKLGHISFVDSLALAIDQLSKRR